MNGLEVMVINKLAEIFHKSSADAGWWKTLVVSREVDPPKEQTAIDPHEVGTKFGLIHSEVSEAMEAFRKNAMDDHLTDRLGVEVEIADAMIRLLDLAGALRLDVGGAMEAKMRYNAQRADHKPEARAAAGGKKF